MTVVNILSVPFSIVVSATKMWPSKEWLYLCFVQASLFYCWFNTSYVDDHKWAVQRDEMDKPAKR